MLCSLIRSQTSQDAHRQFKKAKDNGCSLFELRVDLLKERNLDELKKLQIDHPNSAIFSFRSTSSKGEFSGSEEEKQSILRELAKLKPGYLEIESSVSPAFIKELKRDNPELKTILSFYDFEKMGNLSETLEKMLKIPADLYKIAVKVATSIEALKLLDFMKAHSDKLIVLGMGECGNLTQILSPIFGGKIAYAGFEVDLLKDPEITIKVDEILNLYNYSLLKDSSLIYGVIGNPLDKSLGPITYNPLMRVFAIPAVYVKFPLANELLTDFMEWAKKLKIRGLSVTMPLKEQVIPFMDEIDSWAKKIRSVNNLILEGEKISCYNTDGKGALDTIESQISVEGKRVLLLGAGGVGKAIAAEAIDRGAQVTILDLNENVARKLGELLGCESGGLDWMPQEYQKGYEILINATPSQLPIDSEFIIPGTLVMDVSMKPVKTTLLIEAEKKGCLVAHGDEMFMNQALIQADHWFGSKIDQSQAREVMKKALNID